MNEQLAFAEFGFVPRPKLRLVEVEDRINRHRIIQPCPSRQTLINWLEEGRLEGRKSPLGWLVFEDSFKKFVRSLDEEAVAA